MKTILVLTDLSANALPAAKAACMLSGVMNTNLVLLNTCADIPLQAGYSDMPGGPWLVDDFMEWDKERNADLLEHASSLEPYIAKLDPSKRKPSVHCEYADGTLADSAVTLIETKNVELIAMGAPHSSRFDHFLTGSDTAAVINNVTRPVLVVPAGYELKRIKRVVFATDYNDADIKALHYLVKMGRLFNFHLEVVHVSLPGEDKTPAAYKEKVFLSLQQIKYDRISYKEIGGKDAVKRLNAYCKETGADLLAMVHYHNSFFARIFNQSASKQALVNNELPLLIFPPKMEKE
ncbi:universal stress protein [Mucilaginibacter flavidus]|uniref:universal stress protein n=1 Tax=Mucilaginibacter flavidus TaxID=2949309 RepID=UPI002093423E|nr:universal stress protein [Mucilaginibacter flavidus]MCO5946606.1 universal stress protein [Mucilaginibacter flavidus]